MVTIKLGDEIRPSFADRHVDSSSSMKQVLTMA